MDYVPPITLTPPAVEVRVTNADLPFVEGTVLVAQGSQRPTADTLVGIKAAHGEDYSHVQLVAGYRLSPNLALAAAAEQTDAPSVRQERLTFGIGDGRLVGLLGAVAEARAHYDADYRFAGIAYRDNWQRDALKLRFTASYVHASADYQSRIPGLQPNFADRFSVAAFELTASQENRYGTLQGTTGVHFADKDAPHAGQFALGGLGRGSAFANGTLSAPRVAYADLRFTADSLPYAPFIGGDGAWIQDGDTSTALWHSSAEWRAFEKHGTRLVSGYVGMQGTVGKLGWQLMHARDLESSQAKTLFSISTSF